MVPSLLLMGMVLVTFVQPDPKEIGMHLERYYPDYTPPPKHGATEASEPFSARQLWRHTPTRLAIISNCAGQGNMSIVMVLTSLVLAHHGHSLSAIAFSHMFHSIGMFGFTVPIGQLADRFGRERVMYPGVAMTLVGAIFVTLGSGYLLVTIGTFLVGIGWAAANVASTALIADLTETRASRPRHRGERQWGRDHDGAGGGRHRAAGRMHQPAGGRDRGRVGRAGAAVAAGAFAPDAPARCRQRDFALRRCRNREWIFA